MSDSNPQPSWEFRAARRVEFADTDMGRIVHFSRFFVFMETTEHQFVESFGGRLHQLEGDRELGWPRVDATCSYLSPARFGDLLEIRLMVARKGRSSMRYVFDFRCNGSAIARGSLTSVCCEFPEGGPMRAVPIPEALACRIAEAPAPELETAGFGSRTAGHL